MGFSSARNLGRDISAGFSPPRRMPISEAVKKFMRVPKGAGNSVPWDPELTPYIIEPMNCLASREYDAVIFVGPARTGKTIGLIDGWIVYTIVCDPSDMLVVQMTEDKAREHSKKRLDRTFRSSAAVKKRMSPRRNDNNVHDKTFRDGSFLKIGWPSVNIMSSSDYRFVALTDYRAGRGKHNATSKSGNSRHPDQHSGKSGKRTGCTCPAVNRKRTLISFKP